MIIIRISGGLGNQMFQYALGRAIRERTGLEVKLDIDSFTHQKTHETPRSFRLDFFKCTLPLVTETEKKIVGFNDLYSKDFTSIVKRKVHTILDIYKPLNKKKYIFEPSFNFHPETTGEIRDNSYISGIWQSQKYFISIENILRHEFIPRTSLSPTAFIAHETISQSQAVAIHIRRGDYLTNTKTKPLSLDYYAHSIEYMKGHVDNPHFFVFSDDIEWVKNNLSLPVELTYISNPAISDYEEMLLMSMCKNIIIANSSFSWWAAWLNNNPKKIVIAPQKWFSVDIDTKDLIPETWIKL
jgi:hypothetical protein